MPMRSLNSSVLIWPDRETVEQALRRWLVQEVGHHPELVRLGYFGSYARGDWGVGSDLDLIVIVRDTDTPFERRALTWDECSSHPRRACGVYPEGVGKAYERAFPLRRYPKPRGCLGLSLRTKVSFD
jgi:hypothetical protein